MKRLQTIYAVTAMMVIVLAVHANLHAELRDWGTEGEYFYDTDTGLYWWDPAEFIGWSYSDINTFVTTSTIWKWASSDEIDALVGKSSEGGVPLTEVMGPHQFQTGCLGDGAWYNGSRWIGYFENSPAQPDGWLVQTALDCGTKPVVNDLSTLGDSGFQRSVENWTHGAWINSTQAPAPAELRDWGPEGEYFYDTVTGLYWWDPAEFVGWSYSSINTFVTASTIWKWASSDEIDALVGKSSEGGVPLTEVMGPHQFQTGCLGDGAWYNGSRWIGYFENSPAQPDGWLVQTALDCGTTPVVNDLSTLGDSGFQRGVESWTHGAWINSTVNPYPWRCYPDLPAPELVVTGTEDYSVAGREYTRYRLSVTNWSAFPDELFEAAPDLPPCGLNPNASRTWVHIYAENDIRLYGFCGLSSAEGLNSLWFALPRGEIPPDFVYITLTDRRCKITYTSNLARLPMGEIWRCYPDLPAPELVVTGTEDYSVGGQEYTRYRLSVTNWSAFPDELFEAAPDLPPCGLNPNASRTWVDIFAENGTRLYGFCGLSSAEGLNSLWFALPREEIPPDLVYITLTDRRCEITYTSNLAMVSMRKILTPAP